MSAAASIDVRSPVTNRGAASAPILKTELLSVRFGGLSALSDVNFEVARDKVHAIIGPNGAGKSTFFNCLTGVLRPSGGRIMFDGEDITGLPSNAISQKGVARSYQITNILPNATVFENVRIAAQSRRHGWNMFAHHSALSDINRKAEAALECRRPARQSGRTGRESLARRAAQSRDRHRARHRAEAVVPRRADRRHEPGGDRRDQGAGQAHRQRPCNNLTILIVEHDMQVVMELADRITVLNYGSILAEGTPAEIQENPRVLEVYLKT